jgi:hypothetical protein
MNPPAQSTLALRKSPARRKKVSKKSMLSILWTTLAIVALILNACCPPEEKPTPEPTQPVKPTEEGPVSMYDCMGGEGSTVTMIGVWSGDEEADF